MTDEAWDGEDRRSPLSVTGELIELKMLVRNAAEDIREVKTSSADAVAMLSKRVTYLEEIRVRALEDQVLKQKVLSFEREQEAERRAREEADFRAAQTQRHIARWEWWLGVATVVVMLAGVIVSKL